MALNQGAWQLANGVTHLNQGAWQGTYAANPIPVPAGGDDDAVEIMNRAAIISPSRIGISIGTGIGFAPKYS